MAIILDYQLREQIPHDVEKFPITYFVMNLLRFPTGQDLYIGILILKLPLR